MTDIIQTMPFDHLPPIIYEWQRRDLTIYLLADGIHPPDFLPVYMKLTAGERYENLYQNTPFYDAVALKSPYLIQIEDKHLIHGLIQEWDRDGMWIMATPAPFEQVMQHWQSLITAKNSMGEEVLFRFFNGEIMRQYLSACTEEEIRYFMGPVPYAIFPTQDNIIHVFNPAIAGQTMPVDSLIEQYQPLPRPWWQVTDNHTQAFQLHGLKIQVTNLSQHIWANYPTQAQHITEQEGPLECFLVRRIAAAEKLGLSEDTHVTQFIEQSVVMGEGFENKATFQSLINMYPSKPGEMLNAFAKHIKTA
ncbi:DUF4123 domain-containing protein [Zooshikella harenae]|uniref:DUF4123 domain-containing protein n=1 Tax=Zooshikella harenae TaxID=2827238 RepID=A0ABS5ZJ26_9GAMM|nr:DUF4123 domain-containing protein [Zooshikella harenae]MBU2713793.1 DUF4123 domain-containing protein [Zooshikella harenae]